MEGVVVEPGIAEVQLAPVAKGSINDGDYSRGNSPASSDPRPGRLPFLDQIRSKGLAPAPAAASRPTRPRNLPFLDQIKTRVTRTGIKVAAHFHTICSCSLFHNNKTCLGESAQPQ